MIRTSRAVRRVAALLLLVPALLAGCVSDGDPEPTDHDWSAERAPTVVDRSALAQTMRDLDRRVDRFVKLRSGAGEQAARERALLGSALEAVVVQNESALVEALTTGDPPERRIAAKSLAFSTGSDAVLALSRTLETETDDRLLVGAAFALARRQEPTTDTAALVDLLDHANGDVRNNVLVALWHVLDARRDAGLPQMDAASSLRAIPLLERALFDPNDPFVRAHAAAALGALGDRRAVDGLINLLRDDHPFVRTHTALALGKLADRKAVTPLIELIDETPRGTPRSAVVNGVAMIFEAQGVTVPTHLEEHPGRWAEFAREHYGADP